MNSPPFAAFARLCSAVSHFSSCSPPTFLHSPGFEQSLPNRCVTGRHPAAAAAAAAPVMAVGRGAAADPARDGSGAVAAKAARWHTASVPSPSFHRGAAETIPSGHGQGAAKTQVGGWTGVARGRTGSCRVAGVFRHLLGTITGTAEFVTLDARHSQAEGLTKRQRRRSE